MKVKLVECSKSFRVLINDITHLQLRYEGLIGFKSYIDDKVLVHENGLKVKSKEYFIEFYYDNSVVVKCDYESKELWEEIIRLVNKLIF